jgi:hypothetical protein
MDCSVPQKRIHGTDSFLSAAMPNPMNEAVLTGTAMTISKRRNSGSNMPPFFLVMNLAIQSDNIPARGAKINAASIWGILVSPICAGSSLYGFAVSTCNVTSTSATLLRQLLVTLRLTAVIPISQRKKVLEHCQLGYSEGKNSTHPCTIVLYNIAG